MDTFILTSLLVSMGISTNQQTYFFFAGYLRLAMIGNLRFILLAGYQTQNLSAKRHLRWYPGDFGMFHM